MLLDTPKVTLDWKAQPFTLPDPDGLAHSLDEMRGPNGFLIAFICNHCPYVGAIAERLSDDARTLVNEGISVIAINANDATLVPADSPENMTLFAKQYGFDFPYLVDEDQSVAKTYDAVCTPDFFGFNNEGQLKYRGRLDDARMKNADNRNPELLNAMRQIANTGVGPETQHASMGCSIKWRKS